MFVTSIVRGTITRPYNILDCLEGMAVTRGVFDIWTEREERVTLCLWRAYILVLIKIKLCYTD
jgi:hypothetical protein